MSSTSRPEPPSRRLPPARSFRLVLVLGMLLLPAGWGCSNPSLPGGNVEPTREAPVRAEARSRQALARNPNDPEAHFRLAHALAEQGKLRQAMVQYDRALQLDPRLRGKITADRRRFVSRAQEKAASALEARQVTEAETSLALAEKMDAGDPRTLFLRGRLEEARGNLEAAVDAYRRAYRADPRDPDKKTALARTLEQLGQEHYERGRYRQAWDALAEARSLADGPELQYRLGTVAYALAQQTAGEERLEHLADAARAFQSVLRHHPDDNDARFNLGAVLLAAERYDEAAETYRRLLARNPKDGDLYMALARAHSFLGEMETATTEEAIGRSLRVGEPVTDVGTWAKRAAQRFPHSELAATYQDLLVPEAIRTYTLPGGGLVEVWFYWKRGVIAAFREGGRVGPDVLVPRP